MTTDQADWVTGWRNRIVRYDPAVDPAHILEHPYNPRIHGEAQQKAMDETLDTVGWLIPVVVNEKTGRLVDGHMRRQRAIEQGQQVPVVYVNLSDDEELEALKRIDPLGLMAGMDDQRLVDLIEATGRTDTALDGLLDQIAAYIPTLDLGDSDGGMLTGVFDVGAGTGHTSASETAGTVPRFEPEGPEGQPRLDQLKAVTCPDCGTEFHPQ